MNTNDIFQTFSRFSPRPAPNFCQARELVQVDRLPFTPDTPAQIQSHGNVKIVEKIEILYGVDSRNTSIDIQVYNKPAFTQAVVIPVDNEVQIKYSGESPGTHYVVENDWKSVAELPGKGVYALFLDDQLEKIQ